MFCKKCGMKCDSSQETCTNCGQPIGRDEYCGGFWGLIGEKPPVADVHKSMDVVEMDAITGSSRKTKTQKMNPLFLAAGIVLLGIAVIEAGFLIKNTKQMKQESAKYEELNEKYVSLVEEHESLIETLVTSSDGEEDNTEEVPSEVQEEVEECIGTEEPEQSAEDKTSEGETSEAQE